MLFGITDSLSVSVFSVFIFMLCIFQCHNMVPHQGGRGGGGVWIRLVAVGMLQILVCAMALPTNTMITKKPIERENWKIDVCYFGNVWPSYTFVVMQMYKDERSWQRQIHSCVLKAQCLVSSFTFEEEPLKWILVPREIIVFLLNCSSQPASILYQASITDIRSLCW